MVEKRAHIMPFKMIFNINHYEGHSFFVKNENNLIAKKELHL